MCQYPTLKYIYTNFWMNSSITYLSRLTMIDITWLDRLFGLFLWCVKLNIELKIFDIVETTTNLSNILVPLYFFISRFRWQLALNIGTATNVRYLVLFPDVLATCLKYPDKAAIKDRYLSYFLMFWPIVWNIQKKRLPDKYLVLFSDILTTCLKYWDKAAPNDRYLVCQDVLSVDPEEGHHVCVHLLLLFIDSQLEIKQGAPGRTFHYRQGQQKLGFTASLYQACHLNIKRKYLYKGNKAIIF